MPETHFAGKYNRVKLLNHGPYAKVYQARDSRSGQTVAIKVIDHVKHVENLVELQAMSRLSHCNIIRLVEVAASSGDSERAYIVTEFAEAGDLFEKIAGARGGRLSEDICRLFFQQLISAVRYCHSRRVYHRDIKPENLLLDHKWRVKLTDFGLAAISDDDDDSPIFNDACGTPEYAAPEVLSGEGYDAGKSDIWSCGVVLYVMSAGFLPFDGDVMEMWRKMKTSQIRLPKWMSPGLKWFLLRILDPNPDSRITIDEIVEDGWFKKGYIDHNDELELQD